MKMANVALATSWNVFYFIPSNIFSFVVLLLVNYNKPATNIKKLSLWIVNNNFEIIWKGLRSHLTTHPEFEPLILSGYSTDHSHCPDPQRFAEFNRLLLYLLRQLTSGGQNDSIWSLIGVLNPTVTNTYRVSHIWSDSTGVGI